jgi:hypothetical protein
MAAVHFAPSGPDHDPFMQRARASLQAEREALFDRVPVIGVDRPALGPGFVLDTATITGAGGSGERDSSSWVTLGWGDRVASDGPFIAIRTAVTTSPDGALDLSLSDLLADERDRLFDSGGADEPDPDDVRTEPGLLAIAGHGLPTRLRFEDVLWAARCALPGELAPTGVPDGSRAAVSVVARGIEPGGLQLGLVHDVAPLWLAHERWLSDEAERFALRPPPEPIQTEGISAHQALVELAITQARERRDALARGERPRRRHPRRSVEDWERSWEAAVQAQMRLGSQPGDEANRSVSLLVNQLVELATSMSWWPRLGPDAVNESLRYAIFDSEVASRPAQLLWPAAFLDPTNARRAWQDAWQAWADRR